MVLNSQTAATAGLASALSANFTEAEDFAKALGLTADQAMAAIDAIRRLNAVNADSARIQQLLQDELGTTAEQYQKLARAAKNGIEQDGGLFSPGGLKGIVSGLGQIGLAFGAISGAIGAVAAAAGPAYDLLIGQNERLNQQLLSAQAGLVASNQVTQNGIPILDPTKAIQALNGPMRQALMQVQKDSMALVGVTSGDLTGAFETLISKASILANQSKEFANPIEAAGKLTIDFAATLGTMGLGLAQAQQEIGAILNGTIDSNAQLARSLNITNAQVQTWKAQGVLVDKLRERMSAFTQANALAARSIGGITSNMRDIVEVTARVAGEPLMEPVIATLEVVYNLLKNSQDEIQSVASAISAYLLQIFEKVKANAQTLLPIAQTLFAAIATIAPPLLKALGDGFMLMFDYVSMLFKILAPGLQGAANNLKIVADVLAIALRGIGLIFQLLDKGMSNATGMFEAAQAKLKSFGDAIYEAMGPLQPIIDAGGKLTLTIDLVKNMLMGSGQAGDELDAASNALNGMATEAAKVQKELIDLNNIEAAGGQLTQEQLKRREALRTQAGQLSEAYKTQLNDLNGINAVMPEQKAQQAQMRGEIEKQISSLGNLGSAIEVQARSITDQGSVYQQMTAQADSAWRTIAEGAQGSADDLNKAAQSAIDFTQKQFEAGYISREEAQKRLDQLRNDGRLELDIRQSASTALREIRQDETDDAVAAKGREIAAVEAAIARQELSEATGQQRITALKQEQLKVQLAAIEAAMQRETESRQKAVQAQLEALDKQIAAAQAAMSSAQGSGDAEGVARQKAEIDRLTAQKTAAQAAMQGESERMQELKGQQADLQQQLASSEAQARQQELQRQQEHYANQQTILDGAIAQGLVSEAEYNQKSLDLTMARLDAEAAAIAARRSQLDPSDTAGLEALAAKEAEINQKRAQAQQQFYQQQMEMVERAAQKARDEMELAQTERETQLQELINSGAIREEQANVERVELKRQSLEEELRAEEEQRAALEALPASNDPRVERDRQAQIRQSRLETARLTGELARNEYEAQRAAFEQFKAEIDRQVQGIGNKLTAESQALDRRVKLSEAMSASLDNQVKLLEAQKNLQSAISGAVQGDLSALGAIARNEREKKDLEQAAAAMRLRTLAIEQQTELRSLEIQREQARIAREREQIALRIEEIENRRQIVQAEADLTTLMRDPNATPEQIQAAQLNVQGLRDQGGFLAMQGELLRQSGEAEERSLLMQEQATRINQRSQMQSARVDFAQTLDPRERRQAFDAIRGEVFGRYGANNATDMRQGIDAMVDQTMSSQFGTRSTGAGGFQGQQIAANFNRAVAAPRLPPLSSQQAQLQIPGQAESVGLQQQMVDRIGQLQETMQGFNGITIDQQNQTIIQADRQALNNGSFTRDLEAAIVNTQYSVVQKMEQLRSR